MTYEIIAFQHNLNLAQKIAHNLGKKVVVPTIERFADGEIEVVLAEPQVISGKKVFIIHSTCPPAHDNLMQLIFLVHALKNAGAQEIVAVIPYFGYARHDKSQIAGKTGAVHVIIKILEAAGINRIITVALHTKETENLFTVPIQNIDIIDLLVEHIKINIPQYQEYCIVAPDQGAQERIMAIAQKLEVGFIVFHKERYATDKTRVIDSIVECTEKKAIIVDDIIDTGGTALHVCDELVQRGFKDIYGYFVHPVFSGDAAQRVVRSSFKEVFVSDSMPLTSVSSTIKQYTVAQLLSNVIKNILTK